MGALLSFLFLVFLSGIFFVGIVAYRIYRSVKDAAQQFRNFGTGSGNAASGTAGSRRRDSGDTIIDRRDSDKAKRRIFSDNEGEYVDFEEER